MTDLEIATAAEIKPIKFIAEKIGISEDELELYGKYKAKISEETIKRLENNKDGKLILVTAINPTPAGEGKTTITIGLGDALSRLNKKTMIALREPSMGPVFGVKGGAAGGGYAQVIPMEDINLHFTGDMHAITAANNLLCACIDNSIHQGNPLNIDQRRILVKRCLDMNDRALRQIIAGLGGKINGIPREDGFMITVATEIMAILCLSDSLDNLKEKLSNILIAYTFDNKPIYAKELGITGSLAALLKDAIKPNLVQTLENNPALMHGGPFANIAHGCNSIRATRLALKTADYTVTEAGFGADLGAEKFLDIKCRLGDLTPSVIVVVATIRALKYNGGVSKSELSKENISALKDGLSNLGTHLENMKKYGIPVVAAINKFNTDTENEINCVLDYCSRLNVNCSICEVFSKGSAGGIDLAKAVIKEAESSSTKFKFIYDIEDSIKEKIEKIASKIYRAKSVSYTNEAEKAIKEIELLGKSTLPICIAKTQYSLSDNPMLLGAPDDFSITVKNITLNSGAGFIVVYTGNILTMPGLPKIPAANNIDLDKNGNITGLF